MPPMPFPIPPLFNTAVKDICAINTFEKLLDILFSEVYCWYFGFTTLLFSATITDMSLYDVLVLFPRWPLVFRSLLLPPLVARDVVTPKSSLGIDPSQSNYLSSKVSFHIYDESDFVNPENIAPFLAFFQQIRTHPRTVILLRLRGKKQYWKPLLLVLNAVLRWSPF